MATEKRVEQRELIRERPVVFWSITFVWLLLIGAGFYYGIQNLETEVTVIGSSTVELGKVLIALEIMWIIASIKIVGIEETAAVALYGLPMVRMRRGPKLVIFGLFQLFKFPVTVFQNQFPGNPEEIQKTDDKEPLQTLTVIEDGVEVERTKVRPIRITTGEPSENLPEDSILNTQMTVEFTFWTRWYIDDPFRFIINTGGEPQEAIKQMRDTGESRLNDEVTQLTPLELIKDFGKLTKGLESAIIDAVEPWGIRIVNCGLTAPDLNHDVAIELRNVTTEKAKARQTIIAAGAERKRLAEEGKGRGEGREGELAGEGRGFKRAAHFVDIEPGEYLQAQVARETVGDGDLILGAEGLQQAVGLGVSLLRNRRDNQPPAQPNEES